MSPVKVSWKSLISSPLTSLLNIMLIAFGIAILTVLLLASVQINNKLEKNAEGIDLVVGAKGSPLQLILSSVYHIDYPTGNIPLADANDLAANPMVKCAVPLALGDNFQGFRIVGTDTGFVSLYALKLHEGRFWKGDFEATIGWEVARSQKLTLGDSISGAHGLSSSADVHQGQAYKIVGILTPKGNVTDNLIITSLSSVWKMHGHGDEHASEEPEAQAEAAHAHHQHPLAIPQSHSGKEITALLLQYKSPMSVVLFPRMVNQSTNMQAASPAMESARLFSLIGVGIDTLQWFAILIMGIAAVSVFISLYNSLKERKYDLAVMRIMGASKTRIFLIVILEGLILTAAGSALGLAAGHLTMELIGTYQDSQQARLSGLLFQPEELYILAAGLLTGILAAIIPAIQAYRSDIAAILSYKV